MSTSQRSRGRTDRELDAIGAILGALEGLEGDSIQRVLDYVFGRLSLDQRPRLSVAPQVSVIPSVPPGSAHSVRQISVRDLKDEKKPASSNQMAALVAYYLSEIAPEDERKEAINASDLEKYFKQAGFKLPKSLPQALPNAAAAGYFDSTGKGLYRLNPVGYNLVVHGLPRANGAATPGTKRLKKKKNGR
jgi:hypothetical protein